MRIHLILALSVLAACRSSSSSVEPTPSPSPTSPLSVSWSPRNEAGHQLELIIEKRIATEKDLAVELRIPDGARIEPSTTRWSIDAAKTGTLKYEITVSWNGEKPATDLVAVVDMQGASSGFHAEVPWRFGRTAPVDPPIKRTEQPVQVGGSNLGTPVDMTK
jgi:hypothetical protein